MAKKSKLLAALDAHQGRDFAAEKRKAQVKAADKRKRQKIEKTQKVGGDDAEDQTTAVNGAATQDDFTAFSDAEEDEDDATAAADKSTTTTNNKTIPQPTQPADASASEAEDDSDVPLSELSEEDLEDTIPHQRLTINNGPALIASTNRIALLKHPAKTPFHVHNSLTSTLPPATDSIPDPNDDLTRELEFYRIARAGALEARTLLRKEKIPFTRPSDYFAEMVKSDEHMGRIKKKMYDEAAGKKASEEARKLRDAKKFGKAVQVAKEQERAKEKRGTLDKIKELKRSMYSINFTLFCRVVSCRFGKGIKLLTPM
jgi:rRNA-processing protein EBP2